MADTTISQLPRLSPSANALIPFSQGGTTYATNYSAFDANRFYIGASCINTPQSQMPNLNGDYPAYDGTYRPNVLPINNIISLKTNPIWNSALNVQNNYITVPYNGLYLITASIFGYINTPDNNIRACAIRIANGLDISYIYEYFDYYNVVYAGFSNTHFCFNPVATLYLQANTPIKLLYALYTKSGSINALAYPIYNYSYLSITQL